MTLEFNALLQATVHAMRECGALRRRDGLIHVAHTPLQLVDRARVKRLNATLDDMPEILNRVEVW
jgi:hypothetical protein